MIKRIFAVIACWLIFSGLSWAQSWDLNLSAGAESATGGLHYSKFVDTGFIRLGGTGLYVNDDDDDMSFRMGSVDFFAGSDTLSPGLTAEVGLRGLLGSVEKGSNEGDLGGVAFAGNVEYFFTPNFSPIPIEFFGTLTYGPDSLSFQDAKSFWEFTLGTGLRIGRYASLRLSHTSYNVDMETGSRDWSVSSNRLRLGLVLRF